MESDEDILGCFIEDTREHLEGIESSLMDMEQAGGQADQETVNTVFRAAHSIKGGAGFLGLNNVRDLAHRLENVLHMMRSREMVPSRQTISPLLDGFDLLRSLVELGAEGNGRDISQALAALGELAVSHLPGQESLLEKAVSIPVRPGGPCFVLDKLTLDQALAGGKSLYLVEYDLIHDVHARGKTPLDVLNTMQSSGLILDSMVDIDAVGGLDGPPTNRIPFHMLYATIVEPDVANYLFVVDSSRVKSLNPESLNLDGAKSCAPPPPCVIELEGDADSPRLGKLKQAMLAVLGRQEDVDLDLSRTGNVGAAFVQFVCAAHRSARQKGVTLSLVRMPAPVRERLNSLGLAEGKPEACLMEACPLAGEAPA